MLGIQNKEDITDQHDLRTVKFVLSLQQNTNRIDLTAGINTKCCMFHIKNVVFMHRTCPTLTLCDLFKDRIRNGQLHYADKRQYQCCNITNLTSTVSTFKM